MLEYINQLFTQFRVRCPVFLNVHSPKHRCLQCLRIIFETVLREESLPVVGRIMLPASPQQCSCLNPRTKGYIRLCGKGALRSLISWP